MKGYTGGNTEREEGTEGYRTGIQDGSPGRRRTRKVDRERKTAPSSPTKNPERETEKRDPKRKTKAKNHKKEIPMGIYCFSLN